jgi:hypothetical protein
MKSKRSLMMALVGLAMLATPLTAAAKDHHGWRNNGAQCDFRNGHNEWRENHGWRHGGYADADDYQNYGYRNRGYYAAPVYAAPAYGYGGGYGGNGNCRRAQSIVNNYYRDRATGHPAAANDILRQNQWAFRSGCAGNAPYAGGLFGGLGGYGGAPAYTNYGGYNGYNSGYYGNGYNGGYGQPYGGSSMLAPLLQYIR